MATTKGSIVGREVYDKRAGVMGKVLKEDGLSLVIEFSTADGTTTKTITPATFKRWYRLLDPEPVEESPATEETLSLRRILLYLRQHHPLRHAVLFLKSIREQ